MSGDWTNPINWSTNPVYPNGDDIDVRIAASGADYTVSLSDPVTTHYLGVNSANATLAQSGGTLNIDTFALGDDMGGGRYLLSGGTVTIANQTWIGGGSSFSTGTLGGTGTFHQTGGWVNAATFTMVGYNGGSASLVVEGPQARYRVEPASSVSRSGEHRIGIAGGHGTAAFRNGASVTLGRAELGIDAGHGTMLIDNGAQVAADALRVGRFDWSNNFGTIILDGPASRLTIGGGSLAIYGTALLHNGTLTIGPRDPNLDPALTGAFVASSNRLDMTGGHFDCQRQFHLSSSSQFNVSGGSASIEKHRIFWNSTTTLSGGAVNIGSVEVASGTLRLNGGSLSAGSITVGLGIHAYDSVLNVEGGTLNVGKLLVVAGTDGAYATLAGGTVNIGQLTVYNTVVFVVPGSGVLPRVGSFTIGNGYLELADSGMILDHEPAADSALDTVRNAILSSQLRSSTAASNPGHALGFVESTSIFSTFPATFYGHTVDETSVLILYTRIGDTNLDRVVNLTDFNRLAANFGLSDRFWQHGDFNLDGVVNLADFNLLATNFGLAASSPNGPTAEDWAALAAVVPEPTVGAAGLAAFPLLARRYARRRGS